MRKRKFFKDLLSFLALFLLISCENKDSYLVKNTGKTNFYEIIFKDKNNSTNIYRQSYHFLPVHKKFTTAIKNNGEFIVFTQQKNGISRITYNGDQPIDFESILPSHDSKRVIAFPILKGTEWETNDETTIKLIMGFDRIYKTELPFILNNKIIKTNETITVNGKKVRNCIQISGYGKTSFIPGPPLDKINIEIITKTWYTKDFGVVKYTREEKSDSATTGNIFYNKTLLLD